MIQIDRLQSIIPTEQAIGNKGFATALQQITGIMYLTLPEFATTVLGIESTRDLPIIQGLTQAVPPEVADYYITNYGIVTNPNPTLKIVNALGTPSGWVHTDALVDTSTQISTMNTTYLQSIYQTMLNVVNGVYDIVVPPVPPDPDPTTAVEIPTGTPGAGTYATKDEAILALIALAQSEITNLQSLYPSQTSAINVDFTAMATQLVQEQTQQARANLDFSQLEANDKNSMFGFVFALPGYGQDIGYGRMSDYITNLAQTSTQTGQAVVGCLREGRDKAELNQVGIGTNSNIPV